MIFLALEAKSFYLKAELYTKEWKNTVFSSLPRQVYFKIMLLEAI